MRTSSSAAIEPVEVRFAWRPQLDDADDEMVLDAAVNDRAVSLIIADFATPSPQFGLVVLRPAELLQRAKS